MRPWQKDALKVFREVRTYANQTSDIRLHLACSRAIEAMAAEGGCVPSDLRIYARQTRELRGILDARTSSAAASILVR